MNILDLAMPHGTYRKHSTAKGGEYVGACPKCGGETRSTDQIRKGDLLPDRFHLWPHQTEHGTFWCRKCGCNGDAIQFLIDIEGKSYPEACRIVGKELDEYLAGRTPSPKRPVTDSWQPRVSFSPADLWIEHAGKFVAWAHEQLLANPDQLAWCAARGLDLSAVKKYRLGWNAGEKGKDLYRAREAWGLVTKLKEDGKTKTKLWLPIGLTIPFYQGEVLHRVRIRRPEGEPRYYLVPGSGTAPSLYGADRRAFVVVESELDALLIDHLAGDLVGTISMGNSSARPDEGTNPIFSSALAILVALDSDESGAKETVWWKNRYTAAERHPVPVGKDPGEAFAAGVDIREWIKLGLPPVLTLPPAPKEVPLPAPRPAQDHLGASGQAQPQAEKAGPDLNRDVVTITAKHDGREILITDNRTEYARLAAEGRAVFTGAEIAAVRKSGATPEQAALLADVKEIFGGTVINYTGPRHASAGGNRQSNCYWSN